MSILVMNAGSSSLKFALFDEVGLVEAVSGIIDWAAERTSARLTMSSAEGAEVNKELQVAGYLEAFNRSLEALSDEGLIPDPVNSGIKAVGHRVVHGGADLRESVLIDDEVREKIEATAELAPLHNPPAIETLGAARATLPDCAHVAVFDTSYYTHLSPERYVYPLPYEWYSELGVRRYGFHGISHEYSAARGAHLAGADLEQARIITCHLGNGASATATFKGRAVATTMGFTPADGLMMGTRPGSVDPGILTYVERRLGMTGDQLDESINHASGLLGVSGVSSDYRKVRDAARSGNARSALALDIYADRVRSSIGSLAVSMGGADVLVFTAGIGENSATLRSSVCKGLECLGLRIDEARNSNIAPDGEISADDSTGRIFVVRAREEEYIAGETVRVMRS